VVSRRFGLRQNTQRIENRNENERTTIGRPIALLHLERKLTAMSAFQHILFPVDFSDQCRLVRPLVKAMADRFHARLTLAHVVQIPSCWYSGWGDGMSAAYPIMIDIPDLEESARQELTAFFDPSPAPPDIFIKLGDPSTEIVRFAEQHQVDLIMMPTHGAGLFRRLLLGSVTAKVLHDAKCPVWTAVHNEHDLEPRECTSIMAALDITEDAVPLLRRYAEIAADFGAKLRLAHAVPSATVDAEMNVDPDFRTFLMQSARHGIERLQAAAGTNFDVCMEAGPVSTIVREAALHHDADLVLIGRGTLQERFGQLRTNAYAILRDAPCPVLSKDPVALFSSATRVAASRAQSVASELRVDIGGIGVEAKISISVSRIEEKVTETMSAPATKMQLQWESASMPNLFPMMKAEISIYPLTASETQLDFLGFYEPPLGALGKAMNVIAGHRIAEASVRRFVDDVAAYLRLALSAETRDVIASGR
jgi:nucleotide-binding universal stress UspA family protein